MRASPTCSGASARRCGWQPGRRPIAWRWRRWPSRMAAWCATAKRISRWTNAARRGSTCTAPSCCWPTATGAKLTPEAIAALIDPIRDDVHQVQPHAISITQASEYGLCYRPGELAAIGALAQERRAWACTWTARVSPMPRRFWAARQPRPQGRSMRSASASSRTAAMGAEAIVLFDPEQADMVRYRRKRAGHLQSKGRYLAAQIAGHARGRSVAGQRARRQCRGAGDRGRLRRPADASGRSQRAVRAPDAPTSARRCARRASSSTTGERCRRASSPRGTPAEARAGARQGYRRAMTTRPTQRRCSAGPRDPPLRADRHDLGFDLARHHRPDRRRAGRVVGLLPLRPGNSGAVPCRAADEAATAADPARALAGAGWSASSQFSGNFLFVYHAELHVTSGIVAVMFGAADGAQRAVRAALSWASGCRAASCSAARWRSSECRFLLWHEWQANPDAA